MDSRPGRGGIWRRRRGVRAALCAAPTVVAGAFPAAAQFPDAPGGAGALRLGITLGLAALGVVLLAAAGTFLALRVRRRLGWLADAFDAAPEARQIVDAKGRPRRSNAAFAQEFGRADRPLPEVLASRTADRSTADALQDLAGRAHRDGGARIEVVLAGAHGDARRFSVNATPLRGGATCWRAAAVASQTDSGIHAQIADLLAHAPIGFFVVDTAGYFRSANETFAHWLGVPRGELFGGERPMHEVMARLPESDHQPPWCPLTGEGAPPAPGATAHGEAMFAGRDGRRFRGYVSQARIAAGDGAGDAALAVVRNLSADRTYVDALEQAQRRFRQLFAEAPVGIGFLDSAGSITACNAAFRDMLAPDSPALVGCALAELVTTEDRPNVQNALSGNGHAGAPEIRGRTSERVCTLFATGVGDPASGTSYVVHLIDATEQKRLELQFAQSQKMQAVGQLAGGVAHDFNNLLTAMIGYCDLLLLRHRPGDQSFADLMQIKQNANRAANLVRQLLAFSRQQTLRPTVLSITDVLAELTHLLRRLLGETIELDISHGRDLYPVKVDQGQFEQVIINLAVNARDAMGEDGGHLTIRTGNVDLAEPITRESEKVPAGAYVWIEIADEGHGIPKEHLDRIFDPFFSTKEFGGGTGLGLSTVYGIVKQTGGFILVDSTPGAGTTFRIYLPRYRETAEEAAQRTRETAQTRDLTGTANLLLVEDEDAVRSFAARALRKKGYTVTEASSGEAALAHMERDSTPIDVLITDVVMPNIDGPTLVRRARERQEALKVIFISGYTEDSFRQQLDSDQEVLFLSKPFSLKALAAAVKQAIHGRDA